MQKENDLFWIKTPFWFLRYLWRKTVIISAISDVKRELKGKSPGICRVGSMGVYGMDGSALFIYFVFKTDNDLKEAEEKGYTKKIHDILFQSLKKRGYPVEMLTESFVSSVSQSSIKQAGGDYFYFK
jgi:hypothetical protein